MIGFGNLVGPLAQSVLYLPRFHALRLALKQFRGEPAITEFDWHFTAIHSSSQVFSTTTWFGPPPGFSPASPWPWIGHSASGRPPATCALFRLAFAAAPGQKPLTSLQRVTRRSVLQKVRRQAWPKALALRLLVGVRFQVLFHSPPGVLFTFPSRYCFTIGRQEYLALERGRPSFPRDFPCPVVLKVSFPGRFLFVYRAITVFGAAFQRASTKDPSSG